MIPLEQAKAELQKEIDRIEQSILPLWVDETAEAGDFPSVIKLRMLKVDLEVAKIAIEGGGIKAVQQCRQHLKIVK